MRNVYKYIKEGDLIDTFNASLNLSSGHEHQKISGYYGLATVTLSYQLSSIENGACYPPSLILLNEGKWRYNYILDKGGHVKI